MPTGTRGFQTLKTRKGFTVDYRVIDLYLVPGREEGEWLGWIKYEVRGNGGYQDDTKDGWSKTKKVYFGTEGLEKGIQFTEQFKYQAESRFLFNCIRSEIVDRQNTGGGEHEPAENGAC